ncbi:RidA family protein [Streptomyces sp. NPDC057908]|uniref:RidA family protein n=1 Tax=Streptomyces sp. NPDC057908 TaxID=3346276 RepID=UPI0036E3D243
MQQHYVRPDGLPPVNGYSHAVSFSGSMVAVSGQVPLDGQGQLVGPDDPEAQVRQVFENLKTALAAAGAGMEQVVKLTIYLTDLADPASCRARRVHQADGVCVGHGAGGGVEPDDTDRVRAAVRRVELPVPLD